MLIDWFTVGAQALNFIVLVWLLRRYLYHPVLGAIDSREKRIAAELAAAAAKQAEAQRQRDDFERRNRELDQQRAATLAAMAQQVDTERQGLLAAARGAAEALGVARAAQMKQEAVDLHDSVVRRIHDEVFAIARQVLLDLAGTDLEQRMIEVFVRRVRELGGPDKLAFSAVLKAGPGPARVQSAFVLNEAQRAAIANALQEAFPADVPVEYGVSPTLVSGIEVVANGRSVSWSVADYLATLQDGTNAALAPENAAGAEGGAKEAALTRVAQ